jgi:hypothetical protein
MVLLGRIAGRGDRRVTGERTGGLADATGEVR